MPLSPAGEPVANIIFRVQENAIYRINRIEFEGNRKTRDKVLRRELLVQDLLRHLMLVFPEDTETWDISDQFMIGESLLVAPVVEEGATSRSVYFPEGNWFNVWTGEMQEGGQRVSVDAPIGSPPVYSLGEDREDLRGWGSLRYEECR